MGFQIKGSWVQWRGEEYMSRMGFFVPQEHIRIDIRSQPFFTCNVLCFQSTVYGSLALNMIFRGQEAELMNVWCKSWKFKHVEGSYRFVLI